MAPKSPRLTSNDIEALRIHARIRLIDVSGRVAMQLTRWAGIVALGYFAYRSIDTLAGRNTFASIAIKFLTDFRVSVSLAAGAVGVAYGLGQRKLRRDTIQRMGRQIATLEGRLDKKRTSSKITARGTTNPNDTV